MATQTQRSSTGQGGAARSLIWLVMGLFFIWGGATSLNDILIPKLKGLFQLSYAEAMMTQFAFVMAYFLVSIPAGALIARIGYVRGLVVGLAAMTVGALLFWPAAGAGAYWPFLVALFVLATGITILQVASNPIITTLGPPEGASSRLTFAQAFNSLGTTLWPWIGGILIFGSAAAVDPKTVPATQLPTLRTVETAVISHIYLGIAIVLAAIALVFWTQRNKLATGRPDAVGFFDSLSLLSQPRILLGTIALFVYVGAEVSIGSVLVNYLELPMTLGLTPQQATQHLSFYWGGAMVGRFIGSWLLKQVVPGQLLAIFASIAIALALVSMASTGAIAGWALIAIGLFNSIMFPTIFWLAVEGQGAKTPEASGLLCMAIVGGAIVPLVTGGVADVTGIAFALSIPIVCYGVIAAFGLSTRKPLTI